MKTCERLPGAMSVVTGRTEAEAKDLARRRREDFDFMVVCASKGDMAMYRLLRDRTLDKPA